MTVETPTYVDTLNPSYPALGDPRSEGDDHIRNLKTAIKNTFPNVTGAVTPTHTELNYVDGVTSAIQTQLNAKQASHANLGYLAGLTAASNKIPYFTGGSSMGLLTLSTSGTLTENDDATIASQKATKTYVDGILARENTWTAQQTAKNGTLSDGATIDWNGDSNGQVVALELGGTGRTMNAPTNINQYAMYLLRIKQDSGGNKTITTWNAAYKFGGAGAPTLSTAANAVDYISFIGGAGNTLECLGTRLNAVT